MATLGKDYTLGKGELYFDQFAPGTKTKTGEVYFGNTPELSTSADQSTLDHYDADRGLNVKDESVTIEDNLTGQFTTDNISPNNVALQYGGDITKTTVAAATGVTETIKIKRGRSYQLGVTSGLPTGARNITNVTAKIGATTVLLPNNIDADLDGGRVYIELTPADVTLVDGADVIFTYDVTGGVRNVIVGKGTEIRGALRFISKNPIGTQKDYYWPYVKLTTNGDFALKGSEWMTIPFSFEVLKLDATTERVYIDIRS